MLFVIIGRVVFVCDVSGVFVFVFDNLVVPGAFDEVCISVDVVHSSVVISSFVTTNESL